MGYVNGQSNRVHGIPYTAFERADPSFEDSWKNLTEFLSHGTSHLLFFHKYVDNRGFKDENEFNSLKWLASKASKLYLRNTPPTFSQKQHSVR